MWVNDHIPLAAEMPHGGYKQSGYGKDLSMYSLEDYTNGEPGVGARGQSAVTRREGRITAPASSFGGTRGELTPVWVVN